MNEELICPYCEREQYCHEPDDISAYMCLTECEHCGKQFWYAVSVHRSYDSTPYEKEEIPTLHTR